MASNPYDLMAPLLTRYRNVASSIGGEDVAYMDRGQWNTLCVSTLMTATTLHAMQKANPLVVTDAFLTSTFDNALNTGPGQSWDTILNRTFLLGSDPANNPWLPRPPQTLK